VVHGPAPTKMLLSTCSWRNAGPSEDRPRHLLFARLAMVNSPWAVQEPHDRWIIGGGIGTAPNNVTPVDGYDHPIGSGTERISIDLDACRFSHTAGCCRWSSSIVSPNLSPQETMPGR
jgi:hypothetical protein